MRLSLLAALLLAPLAARAQALPAPHFAALAPVPAGVGTCLPVQRTTEAGKPERMRYRLSIADPGRRARRDLTVQVDSGQLRSVVDMTHLSAPLAAARGMDSRGDNVSAYRVPTMGWRGMWMHLVFHVDSAVMRSVAKGGAPPKPDSTSNRPLTPDELTRAETLARQLLARCGR